MDFKKKKKKNGPFSKLEECMLTFHYSHFHQIHFFFSLPLCEVFTCKCNAARTEVEFDPIN